MDKGALEQLAEAVADGEPVEWQRYDQTDAEFAALRELDAVSSAFRAALAADHGGADPGPDDVLFSWGHLQVLEAIGSGLSGDVYRAYDPLLQREVALKLWHPDDGESSSGRRRTLREARLLARVRHPNVVAVHGADVHDGRAGLWTDLVRGETLEAGLVHRGTASAEEAALIGIDLCRALAAVHGCGLVHGDVKGANVLREEGGRIVLTDFGAGTENGNGGSPAAQATPLSAAPEVLRGAPPTSRSDLYSLGVLLHRLVTGCYPFEAESIEQLCELHGGRHPRLLADARPGLPTAFVHVVERALALDPSQRYATAGEMERALVQAMTGLADATTARRRLRRLLLFGAAAIAVAAIAAVQILRSPAEAPASSVRALAVLPLEATDTTPEFLGAATSVALREQLSRLAGLDVVPTVAALHVSSPPGAPRASGEKSTVAVLHGAVAVDERAARLVLELLATEDGQTLWRTTVNGAAHSLPELEVTATRRLARALGLEFTASPGAREGTEAAPAWEARHALLAGRFYTERRTEAALSRAVSCFERALAIAPGFAPAHAGLARAWALTAALSRATAASNRFWIRARRAAQEALAVSPDLAAAHTALGEVAFRHDWDWTLAEIELTRALALGPEDPDTLEVLAELLSITGRHEEALATIARAVAASPWSAAVRTTAGFVALEAGRFDEALDHLDTALRIDPGYHAAYTVLGSVQEERGLVAEAIEHWQNGMVLAGEPVGEADQLGRVFATAGMPGVWLWRLQRLDAERSTGNESAALLSRAHAALGHRDAALAWLARAVEQHDYTFLYTKEEPAFDSIRNTSEFAAVRGRLSLDAGLVAASQPLTGQQLTLEIALYRDRGGRAEALMSGSSTRPGDRLFLAVTCQEPVHLYVLNEDRRGNLFVLFPLPGLELTNPLPAQRRHRLPGERDGQLQDWVVTSAGGRETILVVAAREALPEVEAEVGQLRVADAGRHVTPRMSDGAAGYRVRGVGGLTAGQLDDQAVAASRLTRLAASLAERATRGEVWIREFVLENPGG